MSSPVNRYTNCAQYELTIWRRQKPPSARQVSATDTFCAHRAHIRLTITRVSQSLVSHNHSCLGFACSTSHQQIDFPTSLTIPPPSQLCATNPKLHNLYGYTANLRVYDLMHSTFWRPILFGFWPGFWGYFGCIVWARGGGTAACRQGKSKRGGDGEIRLQFPIFYININSLNSGIGWLNSRICINSRNVGPKIPPPPDLELP